MTRINRIRNFYAPWLSRESESAKQMAWNSTYNQYLRFEVLAGHVNLEGATLLDVGCGLGDLLDYLKKRGDSVEYTGIDVLDEMVHAAKERFPGGRFLKVDIFDDKEPFNECFDAVYASGTFNLNLGNNDDFIKRIVDTFWKLSRRAFAFNLLHERFSDKDGAYYYTSPEKIRHLFDEYPCEIEFIDDYLENDFTVICRK